MQAGMHTSSLWSNGAPHAAGALCNQALPLRWQAWQETWQRSWQAQCTVTLYPEESTIFVHACVTPVDGQRTLWHVQRP